MSSANNTIVTIGDVNYLWGIFMLIASARKAGMDEPFIVGIKGFDERAENVLRQLGNVELVNLDGVDRSLTCLKPKVMLRAKTEFVTWADSDAFFTGNVSDILPPANPDEIHFRLRTPPEMPAAFKGHSFGEDGRRIPKAVLEVWRADIASVAGEAACESRYETSGSAAFASLSIKRYRKFLEIWEALVEKVLPKRNVGVVDRSLEFYHQLDESTLNACLNFVKDAPRVQSEFRMNKERERLFVHFIAQPKPWAGWTRRALRFFDDYVAVATWAKEKGLELPGPLPPALKASRHTIIRLMAPWTELKPKIARRVKKLFKRG